jgi:hypothetical protein
VLRRSGIVLLCLVAAVGCGDEAGGRPTGKPEPQPKRFSSTIDNAWFPLKPGTTFVSEGVDEGAKARDVFRITHQTKVLNGVRCTVIDDRNYRNGKLSERTKDYYAQDAAGNVWYFGEDTSTIDSKGKVKSTEGTWHAGVDGAKAGLFMPRNPRVGERHYQEYYVGHAEDEYRVESKTAHITAPYGSFKSVLRTGEFTRLEGNSVDHKYYARGVGQVAEVSADGSERFKLVRIVRP